MPRHLFAGLALSLLLTACGVPEVVRERFFRGETPRDRYLEALDHSGLSESLLARAWIRAGEAALAHAPQISLPHREAGVLLPEEPAVLSYRMELRRGERLEVVFHKEGTDAREWGAAGRAFMEVHRLRSPDRDPRDEDLRPLRVPGTSPGSAPAIPWPTTRPPPATSSSPSRLSC